MKNLKKLSNHNHLNEEKIARTMDDVENIEKICND